MVRSDRSDERTPGATAPGADPAVRLEGVVALLGDFPALAGFDLVVQPCEVLLLAGPNGAGKTTVLRLCAGLLEPAGGSAVVLGVDLTRHRRAVRGRVGLVGHDAGLYPDLTVRENLAFFTEAARLADMGAEVTDATSALERMQVDRRLHDLPVRMLSTGQRRRCSFAAMLVRRPQLWLLDEPHAGLDEVGRDLIDGLVSEAVGAGATVLFASHELDRADDLAQRRVTITAGVAR
ncbi:MAG: heme ABC exporter ATP-binding protein CcmA [Microthrixaceae bacterium]